MSGKKERTVEELIKGFNPQWLIDAGIEDSRKPTPQLPKPKVSKLKEKAKKKPLGTERKPATTNINEAIQFKKVEGF